MSQKITSELFIKNVIFMKNTLAEIENYYNNNKTQIDELTTLLNFTSTTNLGECLSSIVNNVDISVKGGGDMPIDGGDDAPINAPIDGGDDAPINAPINGAIDADISVKGGDDVPINGAIDADISVKGGDDVPIDGNICNLSKLRFEHDKIPINVPNKITFNDDGIFTIDHQLTTEESTNKTTKLYKFLEKMTQEPHKESEKIAYFEKEIATKEEELKYKYNHKLSGEIRTLKNTVKELKREPFNKKFNRIFEFSCEEKPTRDLSWFNESNVNWVYPNWHIDPNWHKLYTIDDFRIDEYKYIGTTMRKTDDLSTEPTPNICHSFEDSGALTASIGLFDEMKSDDIQPQIFNKFKYSDIFHAYKDKIICRYYESEFRQAYNKRDIAEYKKAIYCTKMDEELTPFLKKVYEDRIICPFIVKKDIILDTIKVTDHKIKYELNYYSTIRNDKIFAETLDNKVKSSNVELIIKHLLDR